MVSGTETAAHTMLGFAGAANAVTAYTGYRPLTPESLIAAAPEVLVLTAEGLESVGGVDGLLATPGVALTPAGRHRRVVALDEQDLLGMGPATGAAARKLGQRLRAASGDGVADTVAR
jgi:iron complex transport system substrate-binding protein